MFFYKGIKIRFGNFKDGLGGWVDGDKKFRLV